MIEEQLERFDEAQVSNDISGLARDEKFSVQHRKWVAKGVSHEEIMKRILDYFTEGEISVENIQL